MKNKKATILMSVLVMLLSLTMAVSCNQNVAGEADRLVRVSLADGSRGLSYSVVDNSKNVDDLTWYYTAHKQGGYFKTGETNWKKIAGKLEGYNLGEFSQGSWVFSFWGFFISDPTKEPTGAPVSTSEDAMKTAGVYYYATGVAKTLSEDEEYLDITLTPGFAIETKVIFQNLVFDPDQNEGVKTSGAALTLKAYEGGVEYLDFGTVSADTQTGKYKFASTAVEKTYTSDFGYHDLAFTVTCGTEEVASEELRIYVREGLVTTITGDLSSLERRSDVVIRTVTADKITYQATNVAVEEGKATSIELNSTNKVVFAADSLDKDSGSLTLTVDEKKDTGSFVVESDETGILALDLSAAQTDGIKSQFAEPVLVSWYIGKDYPENSVTVVYNGDLADPTDVNYNAETGVVTFTTTHFSEFLVKINGVAQVGDTAYDTLWAAINAVPAGYTVKVLRDLVETYDVPEIAIQDGKEFAIDLNGKTYAAYDNKGRNRIYLNGANLTLANGTYVGDIWVKGSSDTKKEAGDHNTLVLDKDAKIIGNYGIILQQATGNVSYGNKVVVNGQISGVESAVWVLGNQTAGNDVVEVNKTATLTASASDGTAFALQGQAKVSVNGATLIAPQAGIAVRAGELVVNEGTLRSTAAAFSCKPNGSGTTTTGAALAISQHTTKKDIKVAVNGGTFEGIVGLYESNPEHNAPEPKVTIALNGGTFKSTENGGVAVCIVDAENTTTSASVVYHGKKLIGPAVINDSTGRCYSSLEDAIKAVGTGETLIVLKDIDDARGISVAEGKNFTVDFGGHTYTVNKPGAGSTGTETAAFQLLKDSTIVFKNGTITISEDNLTPAVAPANNILDIAMVYANLTLEDMTIDGRNQLGGGWVMSFCNGNSKIVGNTSFLGNITADETIFDVDAPSSYAGCSLEIDTTGTIPGVVEIIRDNKPLNLVIKNGTFTGSRMDVGTSTQISVSIEGGTFSYDPSKYLAEGYVATKQGNTWVVTAK